MTARRVLLRPGTTTNVIASAGDAGAERTLVVLVHHDAAPSGAVFSQRAERWLAARHPDVVDRMTSNPPSWWPVVAGPALIGAGALAEALATAVPAPAARYIAAGGRFTRRSGTALSALATAAFADIARRPAVPGANDNLSGVAAALSAAAALSREPPLGLRILFVSAGAEEALQQGARAFAARYFPGMDREKTWFLTLDTVGSGRLVLLEAEGTMTLHDYDPAFRDLVAACARDAGITLVRGLRSRNSTDGCVPNHHGYPAATLVSVDDSKLLPNYHLYSDTPENVDYRCVADAARLTEAVARRLAVVRRPGR